MDWVLLRRHRIFNSFFAGVRFKLMDEVYMPEYDSAWANGAIANLL